MRRSILFTAVAVAVGLSGCAGSSPMASPSAPAPPASASATSTPTATGSADPNAPAGQCPDAALQVAVQRAADGGSAGHTNSEIVFTNTGASDCELRGAPGVSVIDASGNQIGLPADRSETDTPSTVTLAPGGTAIAPLSAVNIGSDGGPLGSSCSVVQAVAYRVYPPHSFTAFEVPSQVPACDGNTVWMNVLAVQG